MPRRPRGIAEPSGQPPLGQAVRNCSKGAVEVPG